MISYCEFQIISVLESFNCSGPHQNIFHNSICFNWCIVVERPTYLNHLDDRNILAICFCHTPFHVALFSYCQLIVIDQLTISIWGCGRRQVPLACALACTLAGALAGTLAGALAGTLVGVIGLQYTSILSIEKHNMIWYGSV